ncbi:MAG: DUF1080 domain-containing protein [Cyclobacteriaceae bacterium]
MANHNDLRIGKFVCFLTLTTILIFSCSAPEQPTDKPPKQEIKQDNTPPIEYSEWSVYRGDKKGNQYSELGQIHAANVHRLVPVWQYRTGDANDKSSIQVNPIIIDGLMYLSTPTLRAIALNAVTGEEEWVFHSSEYNENNTEFRGRTRGVTYWESNDKTDRRIFHFVKDRIYALNAKTGALITSFGENGFIDLRKNLSMPVEKASIEVTSPGIVYKNYLIIGSRVPEGYVSTPGHIRAYNTVTGAFEWIFHTIPEEGEFGYDTWEFEEGQSYGGANVWSGFTMDEKRGWVFCATGSPSFDFYGGFRKGQNLFGNCILALDATTGKRVWHYQTVHHDIWDYDNPSAPVLVTINKGKEKRDAVVQLTKMGLTFVLDRDTGEPIFPIIETPVAASTVHGEEAWPTQPIPTKPLPLGRTGIDETDLTNISLEANAYAKKLFKNYISGPIYTPPSEIGTLTSPSFLGGVEWQGGSFDPYYNMLYVNSNNLVSLMKLTKVYESDADANSLQIGKSLYTENCALCHGINKEGSPPTYPPLNDIQLSKEQTLEVIRNGRNIMPAFKQFDEDQLMALAEFIKSNQSTSDSANAINAKGKFKYVGNGYKIFRDQDGYPATAPPWGTLTAINLASGDVVWKRPIGEYKELTKKGVLNTGTPTYGGAVATAGGMIFIASTADEKLRAFEKSRGKLLWEYQLPVGGYATPSVFIQNGRQYVTIVAGGGGKNSTKSGDYVMTFALPESYLETRTGDPGNLKPDKDGWYSLFDGKSLDGWVHMNGYHSYTVEDGAIVGRTMPGSNNSFLCSIAEFDDFEMECEVTVDDITNQGIQFRSSARPVSEKNNPQWRAGRVWGPQLEIRRKMGPKTITTGVLYGEALGTGWISTQEKKEDSHDYFISEGWNKLRIVADGPRMQTFVNGHKIEDVVREDIYETHPKGFIALQIHGINGERQFVMSWRDIKVRPL